VYGGSFPARIWTAYMQGALSGLPVSQLPPLPPNVPSGAYYSASPSASSSKPSPSVTASPTKSATSAPTSQPSVKVPNFIGDIEIARANASSLGLGLNEVPVDETVDLTLPLYVVGQVPAQGISVPIGSTVSVQVTNSPS